MSLPDGAIAQLSKRVGNCPDLIQLFNNQAEAIEAWFEAEAKRLPVPITASVDLRYAGFKLSVVDTNLFPAGFNNIDSSSIPLAVEAIKTYLKALNPSFRSVLLLPENHTRNVYYFRSLSVLATLIKQAGYDLIIGRLDETAAHGPDEPHTITLDGHTLDIFPIRREGNSLWVQDKKPDVIFLNNDLSAGSPEILKDLHQPLVLSTNLGWHKRLKSTHFQFYSQLSKEFAKKFDFDPWFIDPFYRVSDGLDFMGLVGLEKLSEETAAILSQIKTKYDEYNINEKPFVMVKVNNGTYGMGVMKVSDGQELLSLNRKKRTKMSSAKGGQKISQVLIQEGVYSFEAINNHRVVEPVIYMIGNQVIGGFYRMHDKYGESDNLNSPGMTFQSIPLIEKVNAGRPNQNDKVFYAYSVVARLGSLAAGYESKQAQDI